MNLIRCVRCATCGDRNPEKFNFALWLKLEDSNQCASQLQHWLVSRLLQPTPLSAISNNKKRTINFRFSAMEFLRYLLRRPSLIYVDVYVLARCRLAWNDEAAKKRQAANRTAKKEKNIVKKFLSEFKRSEIKWKLWHSINKKWMTIFTVRSWPTALWKSKRNGKTHRRMRVQWKRKQKIQ